MHPSDKCQIIKPDSKDQNVKYKTTVFLAGSIEMGKAEEWQSKVEYLLGEKEITIFNPRRDDWDSSWEQRASNPNFNHQVNWEMDRLEDSSIIFMHFDPKTKSPISIGELYSYGPDKLIVV